MQLKKYKEAIKDCEAALKLEDIHTPDEILPGCYSTRTAAAVRLASAYEALGDKEKSSVYKKIGTELLKKSGADVDEAIALKDEGNELFKVGAVLMKMQRYVDAAGAFQGGLRYSPDDAELKKSYMEASKAAERAPSKRAEAGFDKRMIGMLMDLRHNSFDIYAFMARSKIRSQLEYWDLRIVPQLTKESFQDFMEKSMKLVYSNFSKGMLPVGENPMLSRAPAWANYILPDHPVLTSLLLLRLFSDANPKAKWHAVWSHSIPTNVFVKSSLYPYLAKHATYAALVSKSTGEVVDFLSLWAREVGGDSKEDGTRWLDRLAQLPSQEDDSDEDGSKPKPIKEPAFFYTCDDCAKVYEYLEYYYQSLNAIPSVVGRSAKATDKKSLQTSVSDAKSAPDAKDEGTPVKANADAKIESSDTGAKEAGVPVPNKDDIQNRAPPTYNTAMEAAAVAGVILAILAFLFSSGMLDLSIFTDFLNQQDL
ncbi:hypothetical protein HDU96_006019 [Phlyctochytrium bullatum]|nr:hypothetical protein HDU96_006019 [Phlyctochytrium bullatum]